MGDEKSPKFRILAEGLDAQSSQYVRVVLVDPESERCLPILAVEASDGHDASGYRRWRDITGAESATRITLAVLGARVLWADLINRMPAPGEGIDHVIDALREATALSEEVTKEAAPHG